jgi:antitoxin component YwqK of YwqJK toxin-antitoxin module
MQHSIKYYISIALLSIFHFSYAVSFISDSKLNDSINFIDTSGLKQGLWIYYDKSNQNVIEKGNFLNDLKNGTWCCFYSNGIKKSEITYILGKAKGKATFYYEDGTIRETGNWQVDHWVGNYKYYYKTGQISYNWNYNNNGKRDGEQKYYHKNGNDMYTGVWNNGKTEGTLKVYNEDGILMQEKLYAVGKITDTKKITEPENTKENREEGNGIPKLKFEGTGNHTIINEIGKVDVKGFFVKGILFNGEKFNYDKTGKLISITYYTNGKKGETKVLKF